jgi:hypothetical protein
MMELRFTYVRDITLCTEIRFMRIIMIRWTRRHFGIIKWIRSSRFSKSDYYPTIPSFVNSCAAQLTVWDNCSLSAWNILYPWLHADDPKCNKCVCTIANWNRAGKTSTRHHYISELWQTVPALLLLLQQCTVYSVQCTEVLLDTNIRVWNCVFRFWSSEELGCSHWWWSPGVVYVPFRTWLHYAQK